MWYKIYILQNMRLWQALAFICLKSLNMGAGTLGIADFSFPNAFTLYTHPSFHGYLLYKHFL
jgi:hypothetical protein